MIVLKGEFISPLIVDPEDKKWLLLARVLSVTTSRRARQEMAKSGPTPANENASMRWWILH
ncbi:MAG: transposase, partial [Candidatus Methanoculleus thermohydrogenotrophicum]